MLNRAHYLERQAEKAARKGRIEEAIQLHKEAADILRDLLQSVSGVQNLDAAVFVTYTQFCLIGTV